MQTETTAMNGQSIEDPTKEASTEYLRLLYERLKHEEHPYSKMLKTLQATGFGGKYNNRASDLMWELRRKGIIPYPDRSKKSAGRRSGFASKRARAMETAGHKIHKDSFLLRKIDELRAGGMRLCDICTELTAKQWIHPRWAKYDGTWTYDTILRMRKRAKKAAAAKHVIEVKRSKPEEPEVKGAADVTPPKAKTQFNRLELMVDGEALKPSGPLLDLGRELQFDAAVSVVVDPENNSTLKLSLQLPEKDWQTRRLLKAILG